MSALSQNRGEWLKPRDDVAQEGAAVDLSLLAPGDEIDIRVTVTEVSAGTINIGGRFQVNNDTFDKPFWIGHGCVLAHHPRQLAVGDDIIAPDGNGHGVIRAIVDGQAWCRFAPTILFAYPLSELKRAKL